MNRVGTFWWFPVDHWLFPGWRQHCLRDRGPPILPRYRGPWTNVRGGFGAQSIYQNPSVSKSTRLHACGLAIFFVNLRHIPHVYLRWSIVFLKAINLPKEVSLVVESFSMVHCLFDKLLIKSLKCSSPIWFLLRSGLPWIVWCQWMIKFLMWSNGQWWKHPLYGIPWLTRIDLNGNVCSMTWKRLRMLPIIMFLENMAQFGATKVL